MMLFEKETFYPQEGIIENISNILQQLVRVEDWILWIDNSQVSKTLYTSSTTAENILQSFQDLVNNHRPFLAEGNHMSFCLTNHTKAKILILPICYEGKLLGTIGLYSSVKSWGQAELNILESFIDQWAVFLNQLEQKEQEIENRLFCEVVRNVTQMITKATSPEDLLTSILNLTQDKLNLEEISLFKIVERREVIFPFKNERNLQFTFFDEAEKKSLNIPLYFNKKKLGRLFLKISNLRDEFSKEEIDILNYIESQLIIILEKLQAQIIPEEQEKNEHLSHIHHELRTPLVAILGFSKMLNQEIYGVLNTKQKQYVQGIVTSGEYLLDLVNNFLDIFKIDANQEELFWENILVEEICQAALCMVQPRSAEKGLELNLEIDPSISSCQADSRRVKQILVNLLSNAVKFTEEGSVTLQVKQQNNNILFLVLDTGIGIGINEQKKLFQPFGQIKNSVHKQYKGTGLGLTLSRKLARLHGGEISLVSQEGKGSCFTLHLPLK